MTFHPSSFWLLLLLPLAAIPAYAWTRRLHVRFSSLDAVAPAPRGRMSTLRRVLPFLRTATIACIVIALARPVVPNETTRTLVEGVAIELVIDRSDSMRAIDLSDGPLAPNRLDVVKDVAMRFVAGGDGFAGRPNDLVGIVVFAGKADSLVPLTLDHDVTSEALEQLDFPEARSEMGTAIGDAVALGVEKLKDAADRANRDGTTRIKSRVLLLLTDGENNAGELAPEEATALAQSTDVRIYSVGIGSKGTARIPVQTPLGQMMQTVPVSIDEEALQAMSAATGGRYFRATDARSLEEIYATIDALEKSSIDESRQTRYRDLAVSGIAVELPFLPPFTTPPLLAIALALLALELVLSATRLRSVT